MSATLRPGETVTLEDGMAAIVTFVPPKVKGQPQPDICVTAFPPQAHARFLTVPYDSVRRV